MNAPSSTDWIEANQRLMVAEFDRLKQRLGAEEDGETITSALESAHAAIQRLIGDSETTASPLGAARVAMPAPAAIDHLADCFGLSPFERDLLLVCAGVEMDAHLAALCERATGQAHRPGATFGLALAALEAPHWSALAPVSPLRRWRLVEVDESVGLARGCLRIDERILHYLAGVNYLDVRLRGLLAPATPPTAMAQTHRAVADDVRHAMERAGAAPIVWLTGDDTLGQADVAVDVAAALGLGLQVLHADDVPTGHAEVEALATLWEREAMLLASALLVNCSADPLPTAAARFIEQLRGLVFVSASQPQPLERPSLRFRVDKPDPVEQKILWQQALGASATRLNGSLAATP